MIDRLLHILGDAEACNVFVLAQVAWLDELRLARKDAGREQQQRQDTHPEEEGDVDRLAKPSLRPLVIERVQQVHQFAVVQLSKPACPYLPIRTLRGLRRRR